MSRAKGSPGGCRPEREVPEPTGAAAVGVRPLAAPLLLASASPRRRKILDALGLRFEVVAPQVEELAFPDAPERTARVNAARKFAWAEAQYPGRAIIAADTVIDDAGRLVSKPLSRDEAAAMLAALAGRRHRVLTAVALTGRAQIAVAVSEVTFRPLTAAEITAYHALLDPLDRAGGYDIDVGGERIIAGYSGSGTNIMGLPAEVIRNWLAEIFGLRLAAETHYTPALFS